MGKRIEIDRDWLYQKYVVEGLTQKQVGSLIGVTATTIGRWLKKYEIPAHDGRTWKINKPFELNNHQREIIDGALLGDGTLVLEKRGLNPYFGYVSASEEHVRYVCDSLKEYGRKGDFFSTREYIRKNTGQPYIHCIFRTQTNPTLLPIYNRWYKNKIKHIPEDLILTPTVCLIWYLGDGTLCSNGQIKLCTDCSSKEEQEQILLPQLKEFEATINSTGKNNKNGIPTYRIVIPHRKAEQFLQYIGECPVKDYQYKWEVVPYKMHQIKFDKELEEKIIKAFKNGSSYCVIARYFNLSSATVRSCLVRHNINPDDNRFSKKPVISN